MSYVVLYATPSYAILGGDTRCTIGNTIIDENYRKVWKLSDRLIAGCSGNANSTRHALYLLQNNIKKDFSPYQATKVLTDIISSVEYKSRFWGKYGNFIIAGFDEHECVDVYAVLNHEKREAYKLPVDVDTPLIIGMGSIPEPEIFAYKEMATAQGSLLERIKTVICKAADISNTINKSVQFAYVGNFESF